MINRHSDRCNQDMRRNGWACSCGVAAGDPYWINFRLSILDRFQVAFAQCSHYQSFNKRLEKFFVEALKSLHCPPRSPGQMDLIARIRPAEESFEANKVEAWGNNIPYDNSVSVGFWSGELREAGSWQEAFKRKLFEERERLLEMAKQVEIEDKSDLESSLSVINATIRHAIADARSLVSNPTYELQKAFPLIFKTDID